MTQKAPVRADDQQRPWTTPELRSVIPASHTRGGGGDANDQDDTLYDAS